MLSSLRSAPSADSSSQRSAVSLNWVIFMVLKSLPINCIHQMLSSALSSWMVVVALLVASRRRTALRVSSDAIKPGTMSGN